MEQKRNKRVILCSLLVVLLSMLFSYFGVNSFVQVEALTDPTYTSGTLYNNVVLLKFLDDTNDFTSSVSLSGSSTEYDVLDNMYNNGLYSLNGYYDAMSSGKLNVVSNIISNNGGAYTIGFKRGQFCAYSSTNDIGYTSSTESQMSYNLYNSIIGIISSRMPSGVDLDMNDDGYVDSLTFAIVGSDDSSLSPKWSDLLWPHQGSIDYFATKVTNSDGKSVTLSAYELYIFDLPDYSTSSNLKANYITYNNVSVPSGLLSTVCHEMGHAIGLPDYYSYVNSASDTSVLYWDIMGASTGPQSMTAYTRYRMGWIDDSAICDIKLNGSYSLNALTYEIEQYANGLKSNPYLSDRIVAYRITHPSYPNQYIYIEMRSQSYAMETGSSNISTGVLVYRVDEGVLDTRGQSSNVNTTNGNWYDEPYGLYVFRNTMYFTTNDSLNDSLSDSFSIQFAALNLANTTLGDTSYDADYGSSNGYPFRAKGSSITWQSYDASQSQMALTKDDVTYIDSGLKIKVTACNASGATFTVNWDYLSDVITKESFGNDDLYDAILDKYDLEYLKYSTFQEMKDFTTIDLSGYALASVAGLNKFNLSNIKFISLSNNNITSIDEIILIQNAYSNIECIFLNNNKIDLTTISSDNLNNSKLYYGFQNINMPKVNYNTIVNIQYFGNSSISDITLVSMKNSQAYTFDNSVVTKRVSESGYYTLSVRVNSSYYTEDYVIQFYIISVSASTIHLERNYAVTDTILYNALSVSGVAKSSISVSTSLSVDTRVIQSGTTNITLVYQGCTYTIDNVGYVVEDTLAPIATFGIQVSRISLGGDYITYNVTFKDNNETKQYVYVTNISSGDKNKYTIYVTDTNNNVISDFKCDTIGEYRVHYVCVDEYGNISSGNDYRTIIVADTEKPITTLNGSTIVYLSQGDTYIEYGATVTDNYDTDLTYRINSSMSDEIDTSTIGSYKITYYGVDNSGNASNVVVRTIIVVSDNASMFDESKNTKVKTSNEIKFSAGMFDLNIDTEEGVVYLWYVNGERVLNTSVPYATIVFSEVGEYSVTLKARVSGQDTLLTSDKSYNVVVENDNTIGIIIAVVIGSVMVIFVLGIVFTRKKHKL